MLSGVGFDMAFRVPTLSGRDGTLPGYRSGRTIHRFRVPRDLYALDDDAHLLRRGRHRLLQQRGGHQPGHLSVFLA